MTNSHLHAQQLQDDNRISDVVLEARPWPRGQFLWSWLGLGTYGLAPVALASKVQALALRAALTIFCHHHRTHGLTTTTKIKLKVCLWSHRM